MRLQSTLSPRLKLLGEALVETADGAGTRGKSQQGLSDFPHACRVLTPATNICVNPSAICGS